MSNKHKHNRQPQDPQPQPEQKAAVEEPQQPAPAPDMEEVPESEIEKEEGADIEAKIADLEKQLADQKKEYLFLMAEFDNFRKRNVRERAELIKTASHKVLEGLLPIVDDFERGLQATKDAEDAGAVREGMELIYNKLVKYLEANGVKPMTTTGEPFDADLHEAIAQIPAPAEDQKGKIVDTVQKGYTLGDKVLRHAKVVVGN